VRSTAFFGRQFEVGPGLFIRGLSVSQTIKTSRKCSCMPPAQAAWGEGWTERRNESLRNTIRIRRRSRERQVQSRSAGTRPARHSVSTRTTSCPEGSRCGSTLCTAKAAASCWCPSIRRRPTAFLRCCDSRILSRRRGDRPGGECSERGGPRLALCVGPCHVRGAGVGRGNRAQQNRFHAKTNKNEVIAALCQEI